jgi:hypothetical protein
VAQDSLSDSGVRHICQAPNLLVILHDFTFQPITCVLLDAVVDYICVGEYARL